MWDLKRNDKNELAYKTDLQTLRMMKGCGKGIVKEFGMDMHTLLYLKWITNKDLLYSAWDSAQHGVWQPGREGSLGENDYMYMYD